MQGVQGRRHAGDFQSYLSPIQTARSPSGRLRPPGAFNPTLVQFKPSVLSEPKVHVFVFQSYLSPIQTLLQAQLKHTLSDFQSYLSPIQTGHSAPQSFVM